MKAEDAESGMSYEEIMILEGVDMFGEADFQGLDAGALDKTKTPCQNIKTTKEKEIYEQHVRRRPS
jgi:hypothetical protein